jgi:branched-chain amino acid transport system permease protein
MAVSSLAAPARRTRRVATAASLQPATAAWAGAIAIVAVLVWSGRYDLIATTSATFVAGLGIVVVAGWARQPNLGQLGFMGVGAYTAAWLDGWPWLVRLAAGTAAGAVAAVPVGLAAGRVRGLALGALTFLTGITVWSLARTPPVMSAVGGSNSTGVVLRKPPWAASDARFAAVAIAAGAATAGIAFLFKRSRTGRAMAGLATAPRALVAEGWDPRRLVLLAFMISAAFGGCAGVVLGTGYGSLSAADIDPMRSVLVYAQIAVLGTAFTAAAAFTAALLAAFTLWSLPTEWLGLASAIGLVVAGATAPDGYLSRSSRGRSVR